MNVLIQLALGVVMLAQSSSGGALRIKVGDTVAITGPAEYGGEFTVLSDGAIYGRGFGRIVIAGKTWEEGQTAVRTALKKFVKERDVFLTVKSQRPEFVFLVGLAGGKGPIAWQQELTLRQVLSAATFNDNVDQYEVTLFRNGVPTWKANAAQVLQGGGSDQALSPNDVVSLTPIEHIRVWVSGAVKTPGEIRIPAGSDLYRALAAAGGMLSSTDQAIKNNTLVDEARILVRRGPKTHEISARAVGDLQRFAIEPGDDISIVLPEAVRITIAGEVENPGEIVISGSASITRAVAMAGGPTKEGTLSRVTVIRGSEVYQLDATQPKPNFFLKGSDLVFVQRNERVFYVLGEVNKPGRFPMEDGREYRVSDALSLAEGLAPKGTYRRVYLARPGEDGKVQITQFNLDEYLKDGKLASNPLMKPGDSLLFGQPNGLSLSAAGQILSSFVLIDSITRKR